MAGHASLRLRALDAIYADGDSSAAQVAANELARLTGAEPSAGAASSDVWLSDACVLGQWRLSRGDTTGVRAVSIMLRTPRLANPLLTVAAAPNGCAELLDAWLAVASRTRDARAIVRRLDSLVFTTQVAGDAATYAPILIVRLFDRLGDPVLALQAVRKRVHMSGWPRYLATALREEGRYAERAGDIDGVRVAYTRYLSLRDEPEDTIAPSVDQIRGVLERMGEQPSP